VLVSDFRETEVLQKGSACNVFQKYAAGELVQTGGGSRFDQRGKDRPSRPAAAVFAGDVDRNSPTPA
jgi:hypothetical protein